MSTNLFDDEKPRKAKRRPLNTDESQAQGPRGTPETSGNAGDGADDHAPIETSPKEQGGGLMDGIDQTYASGQEPCGTPLGPRPSDEVIEPFDAQNRRQLVLVKNGHRYVFRYERGEETKVLAGLVEMARDPKSELDWFDAAVLSHQLGQRMSEQLDRLRRA